MVLDLRFILVFIGAVIAVSVASLAWGRFSREPRPAALETVHDVVLRTPQGQQLANVLGVTDESILEPVSLSQYAASVGASIRQSLVKRMQMVIVGNAVNQLKAQFDNLTPQEQEEIRTILCTPDEK